MPYLIYAPHSQDEKLYELRWGINSLGRSLDNMIVISHASISRHHAEIHWTPSGVEMCDLNSSNHTFINESRIDSKLLKDKDIIRCGKISFQYREQLDVVEEETGLDPEEHRTIIKEFSLDRGDVGIPELLSDQEQCLTVLKLREQDEQKRKEDKLKLLLEVSKQLSYPKRLDKLLKKILEILLDLMQIDRAAILLIDPQTEKLQVKAVHSQVGIHADYQFYSKKITNYVCEKQQTIMTADAQMDRRFSDSDSVISQCIHASICAPLKPRDTVIGVLYVDNLSLANVYSDEDVEFLTALANQAAIAIDHSQLYQKMESEAVLRDKLERFFPKAVSRKLREEGNLNKIVDTEVTALFSDVSQFTQMSSLMSPRAVIEMLNEYFSMMVEEIVFPYEGTLEKYIGDALVAVWGSPYQREDDAERAVKAAISMQWAVRRLNIQRQRRNHHPIHIHIGLNTGRVASGNIGTERLIQYAHIGDTMNVASRICSEAKANEILISASTFAQLNQPQIPVERLPLVQVKGKKEPLQFYRVLWEELPYQDTLNVEEESEE
ncbi:MAG: FHA domain-containing protein [Roseofilum sp. SBFL]|uniref:adenylate/guanylate cyclase domain-containing protein n=1 Tax=unclassified Roseofilum TaxID=2620099 RepID=UPI001B118652|nr:MULTISPECIES: adenylate/guanylate cyclase domain-containing protein [unclassified Roseofilum]MBP0011835.1 FHA domain-containing protein [Roseofilum sp. SID3]MBP0024417.1 FHA domain-containing protein [Roseofilum sp. SID2]MBP0038629.1 FHA domain-containing protein [Roseofilum sp. SID1]MBP0041031.1 FHA domain-containing protein [Roseofilum sp. SBFL]